MPRVASVTMKSGSLKRVMKKPLNTPISPPTATATGTNSRTGTLGADQEVDAEHRGEGDDCADGDVDLRGDQHEGHAKGDDPVQRGLLEEGHEVAPR